MSSYKDSEYYRKGNDGYRSPTYRSSDHNDDRKCRRTTSYSDSDSSDSYRSSRYSREAGEDRGRKRRRHGSRSSRSSSDRSSDEYYSRSQNSKSYRKHRTYDRRYDNDDDRYERSNDNSSSRRSRRDDRGYGDEKRGHYYDPPNHTLILKGLSLYATEEKIKEKIAERGLEAKDVRVVKQKDTGFSKGFAFIEFYTIEDAQQFMNKDYGDLIIDEHNILVQYSRTVSNGLEKDGSDWYCQCSALNFKRRETCYRCLVDRKVGEIVDYDEICAYPTSTVILQGLDMCTKEEDVLKAIQVISSLPIRSVRIKRDRTTNISRGVCYLEMNSLSHSIDIYDTLLSQRFEVNGVEVSVAYVKPNIAKSAVNTVPASKAGNAAIAAAQWSHQGNSDMQQQFNYAEHNAPSFTAKGTDYYNQITPDGNYIDANAALLAPVSVAPLTTAPNGTGEFMYPIPDVSKYQFDKVSGYYYDPYTTLYYDAKSQYYYNSKLNTFLYWDLGKKTYLLAPTTKEPTYKASATTYGHKASEPMKEVDMVAPKAPIISYDEPAQPKIKDKGKNSNKDPKQIAKEMAKWAKTINHKKEQAKQNQVVQITPSMKSADAGYSVLSRNENYSAVQSPVALPGVSRNKAADSLVAEYGEGSEESEEESVELPNADEYTDWNKIACLLCKRQFPNKETLQKHQQLSELHAQNLEVFRKSRSKNSKNSMSSSQYRDRARERRLKYNEPENPFPNRSRDTFNKSRDTSVSYEQPTSKRIGDDNLGNKLLQKMGWQEGMGLGKKNQGMTEIIQAEPRIASAGLGTRTQSVTPGPGETYKDCVKKMMKSRYEELDEND